MVLWLVFLGAVLVACGQQGSRSSAFEGTLAYEHVKEQMAMGPRYPGSDGAEILTAYIMSELRAYGAEVRSQRFAYDGVALRNVIGVLAPDSGPVVIIGAHHDTRRYADSDPKDPTAPVPGANDGASGVAVLLELARSLNRAKLQNEVWLCFFDAEDQGGINNWPWSVGARYMAGNLDMEPAYVVIVDMIGDRDQQIYWEQASDLALQTHIWGIAETLGYGKHFIQEHKYGVMDDHIPFLERGVPAALLIDLDYPYWHTVEDTLDKVSPESLERVGRVMQTLLEERPY